ncbi:DUF2306 domain-containing protein [Arthrobacter mobilis]|uniref:DUF2306 domain-containing protein n=1 Tax=Arthrobacter mobilis TaxID=2724944 RepID=UPI0028A5F00E|nr:DUF2306 domain-containing protein [Arthrobacter mobilis]
MNPTSHIEIPALAPAATRRPRARWLVPAALILLSFVPVLQGSLRLAELAGGADVTPENARFFASPVPVVAHIVSVTVYSVLGAFQFVPSLRGRRGWHRVAGRILIPAGLAAALSGLWMSAFYALPPGDGEVLLVLRLFFGSAMVAGLVLGMLAIRRRDFRKHGAWMTRAYAIGLGAGTQVVVLLPWMLLIGPTGELARAVLMGMAWMLNLAVAEYIIRRRDLRRRQVKAGAVSGVPTAA